MRLSVLNQSDNAIADALVTRAATAVGPNSSEAFRRFVQQRLQTAHCTILLDGWDEVAVRQSLEQRGEAALQPLIACLATPAAWIRERAVRVLEQLGDALAGEALTTCLTDPDRDIRWAAVRTLGRWGEAQARETLTAYLTHPDDHTRLANSRIIRSLQEVYDLHEPSRYT